MKELVLNTEYKEVINEEKKGKELYFYNIPTDEERNQLKKFGYKWNRTKKCWYIKLSKENKKTESTKKIELKTIKKIDKFDDFLKIWEINHEYHYYGYKKITQEKFEELKERDYIKNFKRYNIYMLKDGYYFIQDTKPAIDNTLYYDDETPAPPKTLDYFIYYNLKNFHFDLTKWEEEINNLKNNKGCLGNIEIKPFINLKYNNSKEVYLNFFEGFNNSMRDKNTIRDLTEEEIEDILKISKQLKKEYIERVTNYFHKYNNHISTWGYWANR